MVFSWFRSKKKQVFTPEGTIIYAIGDIHGRDDLLAELISIISQDLIANRHGKETKMVFLGDYVDRGLGSKMVVDILLILANEANAAGAWRNTLFLKGNHEEALLHFLKEPDFGEKWLAHGGTETLISYGVDVPTNSKDGNVWRETANALETALGPNHLSFFNNLKSYTEIGDYTFVHAGLRPGKPVEQQSEQDLLWIRGDFLDSTARFDKKIVHGHTPKKKPFMDYRRIGIDTGAYITGVLTAVRLEGDAVSFLQTGTDQAG